jgi:hypothetical protein
MEWIGIRGRRWVRLSSSRNLPYLRVLMYARFSYYITENLVMIHDQIRPGDLGSVFLLGLVVRDNRNTWKSCRT